MLVTTTSATWSRALGLSLVFPGGGFLYEALPLAFLLTLGALVLATVLWWGISAQFAIPLVWAVAAVVTVLLADGPRLFVDRWHHVAVGHPGRLRASPPSASAR